MDNKKMLNVIQESMRSNLIILLFLIIVILFYVIFVLLNLETEILTASITFTLLIITWFYVENTSRMIRESEIDRKLKINKEKLSELYSPLKFHPTILQITLEDFNRLKERSYLASENMQKLLNDYFKAMDEFGSYADTKIGKMLTLEHDDPRFVVLKIRFDEQVNADYEFLLDEMKKISGENN